MRRTSCTLLLFLLVACFGLVRSAGCSAGYGGLSCSACLPGKYKVLTDTSECIACPVDTWSGPAVSDCQACPTGRSNRNLVNIKAGTVGGWGNNSPVRAANGSLLLSAIIPSPVYQVPHGVASNLRPSNRVGSPVLFAVYGRALSPGPVPLNLQTNGMTFQDQLLFEEGDFRWQFSPQFLTSGSGDAFYWWTPLLGNRLEIRELLWGNWPAIRDYMAGNTSSSAEGCSVCKEGYYLVNGTCELCPIGRYGKVPSLAQCEACTVNTYGPTTGLSVCSVCPDGTAIDYTGATSIVECGDCRAGYTSDGADGCISCAPGKYKSVAGPQECELCAVDTYSALTRCVSCKNMGGTGNMTGATSPADCKVCREGLKGTVGPSGCKICDPGRYKDFEGPSDVCFDCPPGTFSRQERASTCFDCPAGSVNPNWGATACLACLEGYTPRTTMIVSTTAPSCLACVPGRYKNVTGDDVCTLCPEDTYYGSTAATSISQCAPCPANSGTNGATGSSACNCKPGSGGSIAKGCKLCAVGTYASEWGLAACVACPTGSSTNTTGSAACNVCAAGYEGQAPASCSACPAGKAKATAGDQPCTPCAAGQYASTTTSCVACPAGQHLDAGSTPPGSDRCACAQGWARINPTTVGCTVCAANYGGTNCDPCAENAFSAGGTLDPCNTCPAGEYASGGGCLSCTDPGLLHVSAAATLSGSARCACATGWARVAATDLDCTVCAVGYEWNGATCTACAAGKYKSAIGNTACTACAVNTYSATAGADVCTACATGSTTNGVTGQSNCGTCLAGYGRVSGACVACAPGSYKGTAGAVACTVCPSTTSVSSNGSPGAITELEACLCNAGYRPSGGRCTACAANTFKATVGNSDCTVCGSCNGCDAASGNCTACGEGQTPSGNKCVACATGKYKTTTDGGACIPCAFGSTGCTACAAVSGQCTACPAGKVPSLATCVACDARTYKTVADGSNCNQCPLGNGCTACDAATGTCTACPPGFTVSGTGCVACAVNTFKPTSDAAACQACTLGGDCLACNATSGLCISCPVGQEPSGVGCTACVAGKYKNSVGDAKCTACTLGGGCQSCSADTGACLSCPIGKEVDGLGTGCQGCTAAYYKATTGLASCLSCDLLAPERAGCVACSPYTGACTKCPAGKSPDGDTCGECPTGMFKRPEDPDCQACSIAAPCQACSPVTGLCTSCPVGYEISGDATGCTACAAGRFHAMVGPANCEECDLGNGCLACDAESGECVSCPAGKETSDTGCHECAEGQFKDSNGPASCSVCPVDGLCQSCDAISGLCTSCPAGYELNGDATGCTACAVNHFKSTADSSTCQACALENGCLSCDPISGACTSCPEGYQVDGLGCTVCAAGTFKSTSGFALCEPCGASDDCTACSPVSGVCTACPAGYTPLDRECQACDAGSFKPMADDAACQSCFLGGGCLACHGATGACTQCPVGFAISGTGCTACVAGHYSVDGQNCVSCDLDNPERHGCTACDPVTGGCTSCPAGSAPEATTCTACLPDHYALAGAAQCEACALDNGCTSCSPVSGDCTACPAGKTVQGSGCTACPDGWFKTASDDSACLACPDGSYCPAGATQAVVCTSLYRTGNGPQAAECGACQAGYYGAVTGTSECQGCPAESYCPPATTVPLTCSTLHRSGNGLQASDCGACEAGYYGSLTDTTACNACPAGSYCPVGATVALTCDSLHRTSNGVKAAECGVCQAGYYSNDAGTSVCQACALGNGCTACDAQTGACLACPAGTYPQDTGCPACAAGTYKTTADGSSCLSCNLAANNCLACAATTGLCTECPVGTQAEGVKCTDCLAGTYRSASESTCRACVLENGCLSCSATDGTCLSCPAGLTPNALGCAACAAGSFKTTAGAAACGACNPSCLSCEATSGKCLTCAAGSAYDAEKNICAACTAGKYKATTSLSACTNCHASCPGCEATSGRCLVCPAGSQVFGSQCTACAKGTFKATTDGTACVPCPDLLTAASPGCFTCSATSGECSSCKAGYAMNQGHCIVAAVIDSREPVSFTFLPAADLDNVTSASMDHVLDTLTEELGIERSQLIIERIENGRVHVRIDPAREEDSSVAPADIFKSITTYLEKPGKAAQLGLDPSSVARKGTVVATDKPITPETVFHPDEPLPGIICGALLGLWTLGVVILQALFDRSSTLVKRMTQTELTEYWAFLPRTLPWSTRLLGDLKNNVTWFSTFMTRPREEGSVYTPLRRWSVWICSLYMVCAICSLSIFTSVTSVDKNSGNTGAQAALAGFVAACFCGLYSWTLSRSELGARLLCFLPLLTCSLLLWIMGAITTVLICAVRFRVVQADGSESSITHDWLTASLCGMVLSACVFEPLLVSLASLLHRACSREGTAEETHKPMTPAIAELSSRQEDMQTDILDTSAPRQDTDPLDQWIGEIAARQLHASQSSNTADATDSERPVVVLHVTNVVNNIIVADQAEADALRQAESEYGMQLQQEGQTDREHSSRKAVRANRYFVQDI